MFIDFCLKYSKSVMAGWIVIVVFFSGALLQRLIPGKHLVDNSVGIWFMKSDPALKEYAAYNHRFGEKEWSVLLVETESIYNPDFLLELDALTRRIEKLEHIQRVSSLTNLRDNEMDGAGRPSYSRLYAPAATGARADQAEIEILKQRLQRNPAFAGSVYQLGNETSTLLMIQSDNLLDDIEPYRIRLVDSLRAITARVKTIKRFSLAGTTVVNAELNRSSQRDVIVFYSLITLLMTLLGWFTLRNFRDLSLLYVTILGAVAPTMGSLALLKIPFNMVTVMLPTILIALIVPDVIHAVHDFHRFRHKGMGTQEAARESTRLLWMPSFWKSATDVIGFGSFIPSAVVPISQLGLYASIGITMGWLVTVSAVPLLLVMYWPDRIAETQTSHKEWIRMPVDFLGVLRKYRIPVFLGFLLLLAPVFGLRKLKIDTDYTRFFAKDAHITRSYAEIKKAGYGESPVALTLQYPGSEGFTREKYFQATLRLDSALNTLPEIKKVISPTAMISSVMNALFTIPSTANPSMATHSPANPSVASPEGGLPQSSALIQQVLTMAEASGNHDLSDLVLKDNSGAQIIALTDYMSSKELDAFKAKVEAIAAKTLDKDIAFGITGTTVLWADMDKQVSRTQIFSLASSGLLLGLVFLVFLRSFRLGMVGMVVNAVPIVATLGIMGYLGISVNIATALIAGIAMGIVVDNSLHFINRFQYFVKTGLEWRTAINTTMSELGEAMLMSGLVIIGSFLCMATSDFTPSRDFGILVSVNILISLFLDFAVVPVLVYWVKPAKYGARSGSIVTKSEVPASHH